MIISTYNVNGVNGRLPVLLRWLAEEKPDVVCLQELKAPDEKFPEAALREAGYTSVWHGQKAWNGVAILCRERYEITETGRGLAGDPEDLQSRYIQAMVNGILIVCIYMPNGNPVPGPKFDYKMAWFKRFNARAKKLSKLEVPVMLLGDYNVGPTDLDVHKPESWARDAVFLPEPKAAYRQLLKQGWIDTVRKFHPSEKIFSFWDYFRNAFHRDAGIRMDHILVSPNLEKRLKGAGVHKHVRGWPKSSDHAPVWVKLK